MQKKLTEEAETTEIYLLVCRADDGMIVIPPFSSFCPEEAQAFFEEENDTPSGRLYAHELLRILKVFEIKNGRVVWANREAVGSGPALFVTLDSGCHGSPYIDFNNLLSEDEADAGSLWTARVY